MVCVRLAPVPLCDNSSLALTNSNDDPTLLGSEPCDDSATSIMAVGSILTARDFDFGCFGDAPVMSTTPDLVVGVRGRVVPSRFLRFTADARGSSGDDDMISIAVEVEFGTDSGTAGAITGIGWGAGGGDTTACSTGASAGGTDAALDLRRVEGFGDRIVTTSSSAFSNQAAACGDFDLLALFGGVGIPSSATASEMGIGAGTGCVAGGGSTTVFVTGPSAGGTDAALDFLGVRFGN
ncbi:hypothetical protein SAICODRAFT_32044 [Saitoella complicata NRRL Y-17804]|uniref:uncharacterized protein n=1 Tax=Saitoella complicata (strain BCRC 22490 / CBS 7301 / JCM 7358 / NBRC 10748 / NRRL Y-17804) TaxID=698492 RepID=UPI000866F993|nr:uncharacterized protein SAICODRAFT_32044 [Saitoella complicata NRRL Y-17804]ODQ50297.1 hypothetical protein SAICODRAFT_32044 [Saitoella complicata NRRL Y-17804]